MRLPLALPYTLAKGTNQPLPNSITVPITRTVAFSFICQTSIQPLRLLFQPYCHWKWIAAFFNSIIPVSYNKAINAAMELEPDC